VTHDSIYRIGSISKLFTTYGLLLKYGSNNWERPLTDFIPELRGVPSNASAVDHVRWHEVTIDAWASHLSGIARDCNPSSSRNNFCRSSLTELPI
jgi:CubicO group peptidase (beta-lactamase class C family)